MRRYFILSLGLVLALVRAPLGAVEPKTAGSHLTSESLLRNGAFAEGVSGWSFSDAPGDRFIVEAGSAANGGVQCLCYRNAADVERAVFSFYQDVRFKAGTYYRLSFKYRGDGRLAPMVLLNDSADKYPHQRMFKLKPGKEWQDYAVEFTAGLHDQRLRIQFYPGSAPNHYLTDRGAVIAGRAGEFRFADIALVETTRRDPPTPPGPLETQAERVIYKKTEKLDLELLVDRPVGLQDPVPVMVMIHGGGLGQGITRGDGVARAVSRATGNSHRPRSIPTDRAGREFSKDHRRCDGCHRMGQAKCCGLPF